MKVADKFKIKNSPVRVAILPFNLSPKYENEKKIAVIFRKVFYNYFSYLGYIDLDINEIDKTLARKKLTSIKEIYSLSPQKLGKIFNADALIYCNITGISNFNAGVYAESSLQARLKMVDAHSGNAVWEVDSKNIDRVGIIEGNTLVTLIQKQIDNSKKEEALRRVAEKLSRKIIKVIPDPYVLVASSFHLPEIYNLRTNMREKDTPTGNRFLLEVSLTGEKGMKASFDIGNWKTGIPMTEEKPGEYTGYYMVKDSDSVKKALLIGKLENSDGFLSTKIYEKGLVWFPPSLN